MGLWPRTCPTGGREKSRKVARHAVRALDVDGDDEAGSDGAAAAALSAPTATAPSDGEEDEDKGDASTGEDELINNGWIDRVNDLTRHCLQTQFLCGIVFQLRQLTCNGIFLSLMHVVKSGQCCGNVEA